MCVRSCLALLLALALGAAPSAGQTFDFARIADDSGDFDAFTSAASINDAGYVAFYATLDGGGGGVFVRTEHSSNAPFTIADTSESQFTALPPVSHPFGAPTINNARQVAFIAALSTGEEGIVRREVLDPLGTSCTVADTGSVPPGIPAGEYDLIDAFFGMNAEGTVAFTAQEGNLTGRFIFTGDCGVPHCKIGPNASCDFDSSAVVDRLSRPAINDAGTVCSQANLLGGGEAIVCEPPGQVRCDTLSPCDGVNFSSFGPPSINNDGTVAVLGNLDSGGSGIYLMKTNGSVEAVDVEPSQPSAFNNDLSISDSGAVAYARVGPNLYLKAGVVPPIHVTTPPSVGLGQESLNEGLHIAFASAPFFDGRSGVYVARFATGVPAVPGAGYVVLIGVILAVAVVMLRKRLA
jgi:hypothetical protein